MNTKTSLASKNLMIRKNSAFIIELYDLMWWECQLRNLQNLHILRGVLINSGKVGMNKLP